MAAAPVDPGPPLVVGVPEQLFDHANYADPTGGGRYYDVAPDGRRLLMVWQPGATVTQIEVVQNWTQELLERIPVD